MNGGGDGGEGGLHLPPGFRFFPNDDELATHYLLPKCAGLPIPVPIIAELDLYKFDPWQLPEMALYGDKEWYFFSPRGRKYPNGSRPNRSAGNGYWKATGADKPVGSPRTVAIKKSLVFYTGKAPNGEKTNWIMHEYRLAGVDRSAGKKNSSLPLDDWVLCRIYNKKGGAQASLTGQRRSMPAPAVSPEIKSEVSSPLESSSVAYSSFGSPESNPRMIGELSSVGHEHVLQPEAYTCGPEIKRQMSLGADWAWNGFGDLDVGLVPVSPVFRHSSQDFFMYLQESF